MTDAGARARSIPWLRIVAEGAVIVISILLALAADAWLEGRRSRAEQSDILTRLQGEFAAVDSVLEEWQGYEQGVVDATEALLELTGREPATSISTDSIGSLVWKATYTWSVDPPLATLTSLESSGQLAAIDNQEILTALASWRAIFADLNSDEQYASRYVLEIFLPYLGPRVSWRAVASASDAPAAFSQAAGDFPSGLRELLAEREFEGHVEYRRTDVQNIVQGYGAVRAELARVKELIANELSR